MVKKVREYKSGDFIFAKVKGYPAWPARVQRMNGKKYFVYFYGTGETANLPPNMIFDYAENKDKFLTKTVKRRDFNDGVKQIEHDFANNVPLEQVVGISSEAAVEPANETANDSAINETMDDTAVDTTAPDDSAIDESVANTTPNETAVEDSDDTGALVIDEGKPKGKKSKVDGKVPAKETPVKPVKEPKTPRGKAKKEEQKKEDEDEDKKEEEIVSRSGRKIRPKRYIDEQTEDNATLPSPAPKKRRAASPASDKDKDVQNVQKEKEKPEGNEKDKNIKHFTAVTQSELEDLKEPFKSDDPEKDNILIAYLPTGQYVGVKLFQSRPTSFKNETSRLQWDKQAAANAITLKLQLEKGHITTKSVVTQLIMDLNLTDEEKATLDKQREMEEKKSRVQFLKTEMKLIELDAKIKTCLSLEKADTDLCLKLLDELMELDVKPLMLLKHPTCLETVKRMRAYVGNTPSWDLSESAAIVFSKQAHRIRKQADTTYKNMKELFTTPEGLSFWEFFSERVLQFKKVTSKLTSDELLELVHEPLELSVPTSHTMKTAVEAANEESKLNNETPEEDEQSQKKKNSPAKPKKSANNNSKTPIKRQSSRKLHEDKTKNDETDTPNENETVNKEKEKEKIIIDKKKLESELDKELGAAAEKMDIDEPTEEKESDKESDTGSKETEKAAIDNDNSPKESDKSSKQNEKSLKDNEKSSKDNGKNSKNSEKSAKDSEEGKTEQKVEEKEKEKEMGEPRAKRTRESKKTEPPPPRSPAKRKAKC